MTTTKIYVVLDKSGSMESCRDDTIGGFNCFINKQKELKTDKATLSLFQFDNKYETIYVDKKIEEVPLLDHQTFVPDGNTALLDAIGRTISNINKEEQDSIIVVVLTDGEENASTEFNLSKINNLINKKKEEGWEFIFLGANQDAIQEASKLGIGADASLTFSTHEGCTNSAFNCLSDAISRSRSTPIKKEKKIHFTPEERTKSLHK